MPKKYQPFLFLSVGFLLVLETLSTLAVANTAVSTHPALMIHLSPSSELLKKALFSPKPLHTQPSLTSCNTQGKSWVIISDPLESKTVTIRLPSHNNNSEAPNSEALNNEDRYIKLSSAGVTPFTTRDGSFYVQHIYSRKLLMAETGGDDPEPPSPGNAESEEASHPEGLPPGNQTVSGIRQSTCRPQLLNKNRQNNSYIAEAERIPFMDHFLWIFSGPDNLLYLYQDITDHTAEKAGSLIAIKERPMLYKVDEDEVGLTTLYDDTLDESVSVPLEYYGYFSVILHSNSAGQLMVTVRTPEGQEITMTKQAYRDWHSLWHEGLKNKLVMGGVDYVRQPAPGTVLVMPWQKNEKAKRDNKEPEDPNPDPNQKKEKNAGQKPSAPKSTEAKRNTLKPPTSSGQTTHSFTHQLRGESNSGATRKPKDEIVIDINHDDLFKKKSTTDENKPEIGLKQKDILLSEVSKGVTALINSEGGSVKLYVKGMTYDERSLFLRITEQALISQLDTTTYSNSVKIILNGSEEIDIEIISKPETLAALNTNYFIKTTTQVQKVTDNATIKNKLNRTTGLPVITPLDIEKREQFVLGEFYDECGTQVEFKQLKADASKRTTIADRIIGKGAKFAQCMSGFANTEGGSIYVGITSSGIVEGETLSKETIQEVIKKTKNAMKKLFWNWGKLEQGIHWDVTFHPVVDGENNEIKDKYIVVISIAGLGGALFSKTPEVYFMKHGQVTQMPAQEWLRRLMHDSPLPYRSADIVVSGNEASLKALKKAYGKTDEIYFPKNGRRSSTQLYKESEDTRDRLTRLMLIGQAAVYAARMGNHESAETLRQQFLVAYEQISSVARFPETAKYCKAWVESSCEYEREQERIETRNNYEIVTDTISSVVEPVDGAVGALLELHAGVLAANLAKKLSSPERLRDAINHFATAEQYGEAIIRHSLTPEGGLGTHLAQEALINAAIAQLGGIFSSLSDAGSVSWERIDRAEKIISYLERGSATGEGIQTTQYFMAKSLLGFRKWQLTKNSNLLREAYSFAENAVRNTVTRGFEKKGRLSNQAEAYKLVMMQLVLEIGAKVPQ